MLDTISCHILQILQEKARIPNVEMARQVGMAPSGVLERVRKLEKQGFIDGYEVRLNPEKFGYPVLAFIQVEQPHADARASVRTRLADLPDVLELHTIAGHDGLMLKVRARSLAGLDALVHETILPMAPGIRTRTTVVMATDKETSRLPLDAVGE